LALENPGIVEFCRQEKGECSLGFFIPNVYEEFDRRRATIRHLSNKRVESNWHPRGLAVGCCLGGKSGSGSLGCNAIIAAVV
jgi:hypothetical protein